MIGRTNVGGASVRIKVKNYSILPVSGQNNDIALVNGVTVNNAYIQPQSPSSPLEGDVWIQTGWESNVYLQFESVRVYLTTCKQYTSGAWAVVPDWYVYIKPTGWIRARLYIIKDGVPTGSPSISSRKWKQTTSSTVPSGSSSVTQNTGYYSISHQNTASSGGEMASAGLCTPNFNAGQYSRVYVDMSSRSSYANCERYVAIANYGDSAVQASTPYAYKVISTAQSLTRTQTTVDITQTDNPCCVYLGMNVYYNNNTAAMNVYQLYLE